MKVVGKPHKIPYRPDELVQLKCPHGVDTWYEPDAKSRGGRRRVTEDRYYFSVFDGYCLDLGAIPVRSSQLTGLQVEDVFFNWYGPKVGLYRSDPNHWYDFREPVAETKKREFRILELKVGTHYNRQLKFCCGKAQYQKIMDHYLNSKVKPNFIVAVKFKNAKTQRQMINFWRIKDAKHIRRVLVKKSPGTKKK